MNPDEWEALAGADNAWKEYIDSIGEVNWDWQGFIYEPPDVPCETEQPPSGGFFMPE